MNDLVMDNIYLVPYVIKKMNFFSLEEYDDYYQEGMIGLINASKSYDKNLNKAFSTFAFICIKNEIIHYINKNKKLISLDEEVGDGITIIDTIVDDDCNILDDILLKENKNELHSIIDTKLNMKEKKVIELYYGINSEKFKQEDIAKILGIEQYNVSRIKKRALSKIKACFEST